MIKKVLFLSIICGKCDSNDDTLLEQKESIDNNINKRKFQLLLINTGKKSLSPKFRLKKTDETRNYFTEEKKQNHLMRKKQKNFVCFQITLPDHLF